MTPEVWKIQMGGQEKKRSTKFAKIGLAGLKTGRTGPSGNFAKIPRGKKKGRPSFEELLAKYKKKGAAQNQKRRTRRVLL